MSQSIPPKPNKIFTGKGVLVALLVTTLLVVTIWVINDSLAASPRARLEAARREITAAQARWDARPFSHYRLVYQVSSGNVDIDNDCQRDLEISNEEVVQVYRDDCPEWSGGTSVTAIFWLFDRYRPSTAVMPTLRPGDPTKTPIVVPFPVSTGIGPVACADVIVASYDPKYGYPHSIKTELVIGPGGGCSYSVVEAPYTVEIISLTPLP